MKTWETTSDEIANKLGIKPHLLRQEDRASLALVRAGAELGRHSPSEHTSKVFQAWIRLVDATAPTVLAARLVNQWELSVHPRWLTAFRDDDAAVDLLPPYAVVLALVLMQLPTQSAGHPSWQYIDAAARQLGVPSEWTAHLLGWLRGTASGEVAATVGAQLDAIAARSDVAASVVRAGRSVADESTARMRSAHENVFKNARSTFKEQVARVLSHADALGIERTGIKRLIDLIESDHFRIAVLGEFKRGKSTLVNALVGHLELLPADSLPCTSALIELRHGKGKEFSVEEPPRSGQFVLRDRAQFMAHVSTAASRSSRMEDAQGDAERIPRWRVHVDADLLESGTMELVDTPGLGEDYARDWIAKQEAHRSDAAILVFSASQLGSQTELDLVADMAPKLENLILAINRSDEVSHSEWARLREHIERRLGDRGLKIPSERIVFVAASKAGDEVGAGVNWTAQLDELRAVLKTHLLSRCGLRKAKVLAEGANRLVADTRQAIEGRLRVQRRQLEELAQIEQTAGDATQMFDAARDAVDSATTRMKQHSDTAIKLRMRLDASLSGIFQRVEADKPSWASSHSLITSPKRHLKEIADKAQRSVSVAIEEWVTKDAAAIIAEDVVQRFRETATSLTTLAAYIEKTLGRDPMTMIEELQRRALESAADRPLVSGEAQLGSAVVKVAVMAAVTLAVSYIVADIILYYVLGAIAGFLNPFLLAATLALTVGAYIFKGDEWVRGWVRTQIFEKIKSAFAGKDAKDRIHHALDAAAKESFERIAAGFKEAASELLDEMRYQQQLTERELLRKRAELGTPEAVAKELSRLEQIAAQMQDALDRLEAAARNVLVETAS